MALGSLSESDSEPAAVDQLIDARGVPDVESLYTPAAGGHQLVTISKRDRSRSPRRSSVKELLVSAGSTICSGESGVSDAVTSDLESAGSETSDDAHAVAPVQAAWAFSDSDDAGDDAAAAAPCINPVSVEFDLIG